jgi:RNA polymerase sigma factor (sigma-70 family)
VAIPDHAVEYEKNDYEAHVMSVAVTTLDLRELNVLRGLFFEDKTREELGDEMGVTGTTISRWERELLDKIKRKL